MDTSCRPFSIYYLLRWNAGSSGDHLQDLSKPARAGNTTYEQVLYVDVRAYS